MQSGQGGESQAGSEPGRYPSLPRLSLSCSLALLRLPRGRRMRVLLIEDHKPLCRALRQGLEEEGFAVDVAADGEEGDFKARSANYDVIILDVMLPKVDGYTLLQRWRRDGMTT